MAAGQGSRILKQLAPVIGKCVNVSHNDVALAVSLRRQEQQS